MRDPTVRTNTGKMSTARLAGMVIFAALLVAVPFQMVLAQTAPNLGTAANFSLLGRTAVTITDCSIMGDIGIVAGGAFTQTNSTYSGTLHWGDPAAQTAYDDFLLAYTALASESCGTVLTGSLAGQTLAPGVYCFDAGATLTGVLTLLGPPDGVWIFKVGTGGLGGLTATSFTMVMPGGSACSNNVYWWTAEGATLTDSTFLGTILAGTSIASTRTTFEGRGLATDAVTVTGPSASCNCPTLLMAPASLPNASVGSLYSQTITTSGGTGPYTYIETGALPPGINFVGDTLAGTPTTVGTSTFSITATDTITNCTATKSYTLMVTVPCPTILMAPATLPNASLGALYSQNITAIGGTGPYTFAVTLGSLPLGLALALNGTLSGTPTTIGASTFTVTATDTATNCMASLPYTLTVGQACPTITVNPATLPAMTNGAAYSATFSATGGTAPYTFAVSSGSLPTGLTLTGNTLSGTFSGSGSYSFTITATDYAGCMGSRDYNISVAGYDMSFTDDWGRSQLCVNSMTGEYTFYVLVGEVTGTYAGVGTLSIGLSRTAMGLFRTITITGSGLGNKLSAHWTPLIHNASAQIEAQRLNPRPRPLGSPPPQFYKTDLYDSNYLDSPPCGGINGGTGPFHILSAPRH